MKTLYALFVGIDNYQNIGGLESAVIDANRMHDFFATFVEKPNFKTEVLTDAGATKEDIVAAFRRLFISERGEEDVMLFYFSGHGTQELADEVFHESEVDKKLESFACHDADLESAKGFLADKELRWLIHEAKQKNPNTHFLMISDCCHSGDNTRGAVKQELPKARKRLTPDAKRRDWSEFIFRKEISKELVDAQPLDEVIPQGAHVAISACKSKESAFEIFEGGVFTSGLLKFLEKYSGNISYYDLKTRVKNYVESQYEQTPQIYSSDESGLMIFEKFLGGTIKDKPITAQVFYNYQAMRWEMNMGAIYGVAETWGEEESPQQIVVLNNEEQLTAFITEVTPAKSVVTFKPYSGVNKMEQYRAFVPSLLTRQLRIQLKGDEEAIELLKQSITPKEMEEAAIHWTDRASDYCILAKADQYQITLPGSEEPLAKQENGYTETSCRNLLEQLKTIGKWTFVKHLQNETTQLGKETIAIEITQKGNPVAIENDVITLDVDSELRTSLKIHLTNQHHQPMHVGMVYLSSLFELSPNLLQGQVLELPSGESAWARGGNAIKLKIEDYIPQMGWEQEVFYVQLIMSEEPFDISLYAQKGLEAPLKRSGAKRGIEEDLDSGLDWRTRLLEFRLKMPKV